MPSVAALVSLLSRVAVEQDCDKALQEIALSALEATNSRNVIIAQMNDAEGCLELRHGAGPEWEKHVRGEELQLELNEAEGGIVAYVAATGSSLMTGNVAEEPRYINLFETTRSEIAVPIRGPYGRIRAVLNLESDQLDAFDENARQLAEAYALIAGMILERQESQAREEALVQVGSALDTTLTEDALIDQVMRVAGEVLRFQASSIFLHEPATDTFVLRGSIGRLRERVGEISYARGEGCTGWVCDKGQPMRLDHPQKDPRWRGRFVEFPQEEIAHFLAVPIVSRGRSIGAIRVIRQETDNPYLDNRFTDSDQRVLQAIADQMATGLENIRNVEKMLRSERMVAWGELSAKSSHMIGNRVFALKGDVNELEHLLAAAQLDRAELRAIQKSLETNVMRVEEILQDFRDFLTATQLVPERANLNKLVEETVREVFPRRSPVELQLELGADVPEVVYDPKKLRRALSELIENSLNYIQEGRLKVATGEASIENLSRLKGWAGKPFVQIEVEDTGPGVREEQKGVIFQPFYSSRVKGMGLGLSIVKGIVDAHGGHVFEAGQEGKGAKFVILLPAA